MKLNLRHLCFQWLPLMCYCCFLFVQSSYPPLRIIPKILYMDKILHFFAYAVLGILFYRAYKTIIFKNDALTAILSIVSASLFALSDEWHQLYVKSRSADYKDFIADVVGSIHGVCIYAAVIKYNWHNPLIHGLTKLRTFSRNTFF